MTAKGEEGRGERKKNNKETRLQKGKRGRGERK